MKKRYLVLPLPGRDGITRRADNKFFPNGSEVDLDLAPADEKALIEMKAITPVKKEVVKDVKDTRKEL